jgi:Ca2+-binding RTX toxin-like protein
VIDWGNGAQTFTDVAAGPFSYSRQYLDDNLDDSYSIRVTVRDDDGGESTTSTAVTVTNVAPTVTELSTAAISETGTTTLSGTIGDIGTLDTFIVEIDWGNGIETFTNISAGPFQYTRPYADDNAADSYPIHITVTDDDGGVGVADASVAVINLDPTATDNDYSTAQAGSVSGNVIDDGVADHDPAASYDPLVVDAVNGSTASVGRAVSTFHGTVVVHADGTFMYTPASTFAGDDSFTYTLTDGDGGSSTATVTIHVAAAAAGSMLIVPDNCLGGTALLITGTALGDSIVVAPGSTAATLVVIFNGVSTIVARPSGRIIVIGGNGDDNIQIAGAIADPAWLYGEAGNDRLNAGNGGSLLIGGAGDDHLLGGGGRDVMIGGEGADHLVGNSGDDILVADYTTLDERASAAHEAFWCHVLEEWNSSNGFAARVQNLKDGAGGNAHNGSSFLLQQVRAELSPDAIDFLNGAAGDDWLIFVDTEDRVGGQAEASNEL